MTVPQFPVLHPAHGASNGCVVFLHGGNVANWMWHPQVEALPDYQVITPDLPGFGARTDDVWINLDQAADTVAALISAEAQGPVHLVGLSLGGVVALRLLARYPLLVSSALVSGVPALGIGGLTGALARLQLRCWDYKWFWQVQARAFGLPPDSRGVFVEHGLRMDGSNARQMMAEVFGGGLPPGLADYRGRLLALAGSKEPQSVKKALPLVVESVPDSPDSEGALVPGMRHVWSVQDSGLFNEVVREWIDGSIHARLDILRRTPQ